jgi:hypothetical protein
VINKKSVWVYGWVSFFNFFMNINNLSEINSDYPSLTKIFFSTMLPTKLVFFDIETITNKNKILVPVCNLYTDIDECDLNEFDWEQKKDIYNEKYCYNYNINLNYINNYDDGTLDEKNPLIYMIEDLLEWSNYNKVVLIGYNSSGFDMFFVIHVLMSQLKSNKDEIDDKNIEVFVVKNKIYCLKYKNIKSFDLYLHLRMSLFDACNAFKTEPKKDKESGEKVLELLQKAYENNTLLECFEQNREILKNYNKLDVYSLISLTKNYQNLINSLEPFKGYKVWNSLTLPSMINKYFQENVYEQENYVKPYTRYDYLTFKSYQVAGIVGIFGESTYSKKIKNVHLLDIVSQYPYVCLENDFPKDNYSFFIFDCVVPFDVDEIIDKIKKQELPNLLDKLGDYWCEVNTSSHYIPIVGKKNKNKTNSWFRQQNKPYECPLTTPEIEYLIKEKCYVKIISGYTFEGKGNPFKNFMYPIAKRKIELDRKKYFLEKEGYNLSDGESTLRALKKLILNATTGSVNQKLHESKTIIKADGLLDVKNLKINPNISLLEQKYQTKKVPRPYFGNFIYAYARLLICEIVNEIEKYNFTKKPCVLYGDTDSLVITQGGLNIWKNNEKIKNRLLNEEDETQIGEFGFYKEEGFFSDGYLIDKKIYILYNINKCYPKCNCSLDVVKKGECKSGNKYRLKGIGKGLSVDTKNGYYLIPLHKNINMLNKDLKKFFDKKCDIKTCLFINQLSHQQGRIFTKEESYRLYEKNYYIQMRIIETENVHFDTNNVIINMRDIKIYDLLLNNIVLKCVRENMLDRQISKNYYIRQITKERYISPNTFTYNLIKLNKELNSSLKKCNIL